MDLKKLKELANHLSIPKNIRVQLKEELAKLEPKPKPEKAATTKKVAKKAPKKDK